MSQFANQLVLITGAAGALGAAVAQHFTEHGATIAQLDLAPIDNGHWSLTCDLTNAADTQRAVQAVQSEFKRIDVLANIAGGFTMGDAVDETSIETWDFMFDLNARSIFNTARAVVPAMRSAGAGKIISIGARAGLRGGGQMGAYSAAKSVVHRLTESMADELKHAGINVNCVLPSLIDTPRNRSDMPDADFSQWVTPAAIAEVIGFLASPAAAAVHGACIPVEGLS